MGEGTKQGFKSVSIDKAYLQINGKAFFYRERNTEGNADAFATVYICIVFVYYFYVSAILHIFTGVCSLCITKTNL